MLKASDEDHGALPAVSFAFQAIVDVAAQRTYSYEALIRGQDGQPAHRIFKQVPESALYAFDDAARIQALDLAARLRLECCLNLNCLPRSLYHSSTALASTAEAALRHGFALEQIILEVTEGEMIDDHARFIAAVNEFRAQGLKLAIDDFGAGYSGLNLLVEFQPDVLKLDMALVRGIESRGPRQAVVRAILGACADLGIDVIAEGVETANEYDWFMQEGVRLFQGYLFGKPVFERLPLPVWPVNCDAAIVENAGE